MIMSPSLRKLALTTHVIASVGWVGALAVFLAHAIASLTSQDPLIARAACLAMGLTAWFVIFPLSLASTITGILQALGTAWGLFRHYWVLAKLFLTLFATAVLLLKLAPISALADAAAGSTFSPADLLGARVSLLLHASGGLLVLLTVATLAIYKPQGLTRFGIRKQRELRGVESGSAFEGVAVMPRWVKVFGIIAIVLILVLAVMMLGGQHGPAAHMSSES